MVMVRTVYGAIMLLNSMKQIELDGRNTMNFMCSFHDKMADVFNNREYIPTSWKLPDLYPNFKEE